MIAIQFVQKHLSHLLIFLQYKMLPTTAAAAAAILLVFLGCLWSSIIHHWRRLATTSSQFKNDLKLPPSPRSLPIIGNLHMLGNLPHRSLQKLAKKYGPIMSIRLGHVTTIVVSSPQIAELFLKTHDVIFASRPKVQASEYMSYGAKGVGFTEYGPYWRNVRKLCTLELFTALKIEFYGAMRKEEVGMLVESLKKSAARHEIVNVSTKVVEVIEEISYKMIFGRSTDKRFDLKCVIHEYIRLLGAFNISDYVPWLAPLDLQGLARHMKATSKEIDKILEILIDEHEQNESEHQRQYKDFTDVLLSVMNKSRSLSSNKYDLNTLDRANVKAILLDMLAATVDTTSTTMQWCVLELIKHPRVMRKLQEEIESVVGLSKMVQETDLTKLIYLDMVLKETFRLHSVGPLLVPHESLEDIVINGYDIPKKSRIIVNIWAIGHDPEVWSDNVEDFYPERFEGSDVDYRGRNFQLIPFGAGRRGCPGMQLGLTMVKLGLAQLVHCFDWELPKGMLPNDLDMIEKFGLALTPANDLLAIPTYRLRLHV